MGSIKQPQLLCQQVFQPTVHYPLNLLSFCHDSLPSTTPHFTLRPILCAPLTLCLQVSHTSLLLCTFDKNMQALWPLLCKQKGPKCPCFIQETEDTAAYRTILCLWRVAFLLGVQRTFANQMQAAESGHIQMTSTPTCISDNWGKHCSYWHIENDFQVQSLVPRQGFDNSALVKIQSHQQDRLCRPIVKEHLLLCQNIICYSKAAYCNTENTSCTVMS